MTAVKQGEVGATKSWSGDANQFEEVYTWAGGANVMETGSKADGNYELRVLAPNGNWETVNKGDDLELVEGGVKLNKANQTQVPSSTSPATVPDPIPPAKQPGPDEDKGAPDSGIETKPAMTAPVSNTAPAKVAPAPAKATTPAK